VSHQYIRIRLLTSELNESIISWFPVFHFMKNVTYTYYKNLLKYTCAKTCQYRSRFDKVIRKI